MNHIEITIEETPNPATLKFKLNQKIIGESLEFKNVSEAEHSPLAMKLFGFPWCQSVFIGFDFISITKQDWVSWEILSAPLADLIIEHFERKEPIYIKPIPPQTKTTSKHSKETTPDTPEVKLIKEILEKEIRPAVAMDGGDVVFESYKNNVVYLHLRGACAGCPGAKMTLKMGIETRLKEKLPEIKEVVSI